ncbi:MAG: Bax inhibitor-1 family protein, partial [Rickettsiales bacterium]|nr:Bax inhibitor-1 family protein [Rickettsiales bacterium]
LKNGTVDYFLSLAGVVVFVLFTAFDIQRLKVTYSNSMFSGADDEMTHRLAIRGALELYLDFVNLFMYLLRFLGKRKND